MRSKYLLIALVLTVLLLGLAWLVGDPIQPNDRDRRQTQQALVQGLTFLQASHTPYHFYDPYLEFVYPEEQLQCPLPDCRVTYRTMDAYFALAMLRERLTTEEQRLIRDMLDEQAAVFAALAPEWRTADIAGTVLSDETDDTAIALDTYCILGYLTKDRAMAENTLRYLPESGEWFRADHFLTDQWRNIADETWCIRLLAATETYPEQLQTMVETKLIEAQGFLQSQKPIGEKIAAAYHVLLMLSEPNISSTNDQLARLQNDIVVQISSASQPIDAVSMANSLEMLTMSDYSSSAYLDGLRQNVLQMQGDDGAWRYGDGNTFAVFSTLRSLLGLTSDRSTL